MYLVCQSLQGAQEFPQVILPRGKFAATTKIRAIEGGT